MRKYLVDRHASVPIPLKVLLVVPYPVLPSWHGGSIRVVAIARALEGLGHAVTVLTPWKDRRGSRLSPDEPFTLWRMPYPFVLPTILADRPFPFFHLMSFHPGLRLVTARLFEGFDVVQFEHVSFAGLLGCVPASAVCGYDAHNVEYDYIRQECHGHRIEEIVGRRIRRLERAVVTASDCVFSVSVQDRERLSSLYGLRSATCTLAPNGVRDARPAAKDDAATTARFPGIGRFRVRAIFSGGNAEHNRRAVAFLLDQVAPAARDVGFVIHGSCATRFERLCSLPNVFFDADPEVRNFSDYAGPGMIGLNAVETGGGTNLKLLHYLSRGMPVLSTPFGMRGYDDLAGFVRVAPRQEFASALADGHFPAPPAPSFLMDRYSWSGIAARIADTYATRIAARAHA